MSRTVPRHRRPQPTMGEALLAAFGRRRQDEAVPAAPAPAVEAEEAPELAEPELAADPAPSARDAMTAPLECVVVEEIPAAPSTATLDYPDGSRLPVGYEYGGPEGSRQRWIALVPDSARLVNGMVLRVERDTVLAVAVRDGAAAVHGLPR